MNLEGLIPIVGGMYFTLFGFGVLPKNIKDQEKWGQWRKKFGPIVKILGPCVVLFGVLQLFNLA